MQVPLDAEGARKVFKLIDALEDSDEVQNVYSNFDVSDQVLEEVNAYGTGWASIGRPSGTVGARS